jgi:hypothetical protein
MNEKRREKLRTVLKDLELILEEEDKVLCDRPGNLQSSGQYEFHEKRWLALQTCVEELKKAIY